MRINFDHVFEFQKERYQEIVSRDLLKKSDTEIICTHVENGILLPVRGGVPESLFGAGGVIRDNREYVMESATHSRGHVISYPGNSDLEYYVGGVYEFDDRSIEKIDETIVYLGYINNHWGHFIIDLSSRLWYASENTNEYRYAFIVDEGAVYSPIAPIKEFLRYTGVHIEHVLFINKPTKFTNVIVPMQSYVTNEYYSQKYLSLYDTVVEHALQEIKAEEREFPEKIYFTRRAYKKAARTEIGEELLLDFFQNNGFKVISPELCDLKSQIAYIRNAKVVAGIIGTIPHNMIFAAKGQKLIIINKTNIVNVMQMDINMMKELNVDYIDTYACLIPRTLGGGPFLIVETPEFQSYYTKHGYHRPSELYHSASYIKKNVRQYTNLLVQAVPYNSKVTMEKESVHYFEPALSLTFAKNYYHIIGYNPLSAQIKNSVINQLKAVKKILKK